MNIDIPLTIREGINNNQEILIIIGLVVAIVTGWFWGNEKKQRGKKK